MKHTFLLALFLLFFSAICLSQQANLSPCKTDIVYRQFDFWIGEWIVFDQKGNKAGDSKIDLILDSCIIMENWVSSGNAFSGKSFNTYNASTGQWQQTWVDNAGGSTAFMRGKAEKNKITFQADSLRDTGGKIFDRRLTFYNLSPVKVRQHGERSDDGGKTWTTEYDLEYRRKDQ